MLPCLKGGDHLVIKCKAPDGYQLHPLANGNGCTRVVKFMTMTKFNASEVAGCRNAKQQQQRRRQRQSQPVSVRKEAAPKEPRKTHQSTLQEMITRQGMKVCESPPTKAH